MHTPLSAGHRRKRSSCLQQPRGGAGPDDVILRSRGVRSALPRDDERTPDPLMNRGTNQLLTLYYRYDIYKTLLVNSSVLTKMI